MYRYINILVSFIEKSLLGVGLWRTKSIGFSLKFLSNAIKDQNITYIIVYSVVVMKSGFLKRFPGSNPVSGLLLFLLEKKKKCKVRKRISNFLFIEDKGTNFFFCVFPLYSKRRYFRWCDLPNRNSARLRYSSFTGVRRHGVDKRLE